MREDVPTFTAKINLNTRYTLKSPNISSNVVAVSIERLNRLRLSNPFQDYLETLNKDTYVTSLFFLVFIACRGGYEDTRGRTTNSASVNASDLPKRGRTSCNAV